MDIILRTEQSCDYRETEEVTREAFWNYHSPGCDEHYLIHIMRGCAAFLPELDIVAVCGGKIVGNVVCLKSLILTDTGNECEVLSLGPISVLPEFQGRGIGSRLIAHTQNLARKMGYRAILLYGDPNYYTRHGFVAAETLGIRTSDNMYAVPLHVCELYENALLDMRGRYFEDDIYNVDAVAAEAFDKLFPPKEKIKGTPSQSRFDELVALRKTAQ